jgi:hypothetical protein
LIDYGRSLLRVAVISFGVATFYGAIYRIFPNMLDWKDSAESWFTPYYFSIVTYLTLGFGDVRPATLAGEIIVKQRGYSRLHDARVAAFRPRAKHRSAQLTCEPIQESPTSSAAFSR